MVQLNENVRVILAHLKEMKGWSMKDVSEQAFFFAPEDRERFYKWLRRVKRGERVARHHGTTVKFERALRWMIHSNELLFEDEHLDFTLKRFDVIERVLRLAKDQHPELIERLAFVELLVDRWAMSQWKLDGLKEFLKIEGMESLFSTILEEWERAIAEEAPFIVRLPWVRLWSGQFTADQHRRLQAYFDTLLNPRQVAPRSSADSDQAVPIPMRESGSEQRPMRSLRDFMEGRQRIVPDSSLSSEQQPSLAAGPNAESSTETPTQSLRPSRSAAPQRKTTQPRVVVKWTGSKQRQAAEILGHFPTQIETYYEPFLGGASLLLGLLLSEIQVKRFRCSDINPALIGIWTIIKDDPDALFQFYERFWDELQRRGEEFYYETRTKFNEDRDPLKFFALLRTCRNGFVRFNREGEFNSGFHHQRRGIHPKSLRPLLEACSARLKAVDVRFEVKDYRSIESASGDFLYLDPPYKSRRGDTYGVRFDVAGLWTWLESQTGSYALSLNGFKGDQDMRVDVPSHLYDESFLIDSGTNPFLRMTNRRVIDRDSLYVRLTKPFAEAGDVAFEPSERRSLLIAAEAKPVATEAKPASMPPNEEIDEKLVERIRERVHTAKFETRDAREVLLSDLLTGRKGDHPKGTVPKLNDPTARYFKNRWRNAVIKRIGAGLALADAIDAELNDWLATQK